MATSKFSLKCALCRQDFDRLNVLSCNHKLCEQCCRARKKSGKTVECPIPNCSIISDTKVVKVRNYKTFTDTLISMNEKSVLHSVQEYQTVIDEQEVNLERQIYSIEKQLDETSENIEKGSDDLNKLYKKRQKELKRHFKTLKDDMIEIGMKRKEQLNCILSLVNELKDELQKQRQWLADIMRKNAKSMDLDPLQEDIEDRMSRIEMVDMDIPPMTIELVPNDEWTTKDSLTISAPDVSVHRQTLKTMTNAESDFTELSNRTLVKVKQMDLPGGFSTSVCVLNGMIYCACEYKGIVITDITLTDKRYIEAGDMNCVFSVAALSDSTLIAAATNGLFHITTDGALLKDVAKG